MRELFWNGSLPSNWDIGRADSVLEYNKNSIRVDVIKGGIFFHYSIPSIHETGDGIIEEGNEIESDKILLEGNELLVSKLNPEKGCVLIAQPKELPIICSTEFVPLKPKSGIEPRFAFYVYFSEPARDFISAKSQSTTRSHKRVSPEDISKMWIPLPPLPTQRLIAAYLDRETARIDALIAAKERLLALLAEKRQALITRAVTKGLNPEAKMKSSGVAWLGEAPEGWEVKKVKFLGDIYYGLSQPPEYQMEGLPLIRATNVYRGVIKKEGLVFINEDDLPPSKKVVLKSGDIIVVRSGAYTADSALITEEWEGAIAGFDMIFRPNELVLPKFLAFVFLCGYVLENQLIPMSVRAAQPHLNAEELGSVQVIIPPTLREQSAIFNYIETHTARLDALRAATERSIALLLERRSALIAAAVTGRVEVDAGGDI